MGRRLTAVVGSLALILTILPNLPAADVLDCCSGIMCPMHAAPHVDCGIDLHGSDARLKPCPVPVASHYTVATIFVLLNPVALHDGAPSEPLNLFQANFSPDAEQCVDSPPPRLLRTA